MRVLVFPGGRLGTEPLFGGLFDEDAKLGLDPAGASISFMFHQP